MISNCLHPPLAFRPDGLSFPDAAAACRSPSAEWIRGSEYSPEDIDAILEGLREHTEQSGGQWIALDLAQIQPQTQTLTEILCTAICNARCGMSLQFSLPGILPHRPRAAHPFISEAIQWQKLCDLLLLDDDPMRETVLVLEHFNPADSNMVREINRILRFHESHTLNRRVILTGQ
ncbi:MAG: hypothetical protein LBH00_04035 [Planctomycetaceae bacterium]|nr:hypothetical protein [Planctomycetaceae bacterium]